MPDSTPSTATYQPTAQVLASRIATVGGLFHGRVAACPDHVAIVDGPRRLSYRALEARSNRLANAWLAQGLQPGDRVGLLAHNCQEYLEAELAAAKAGLVIAALNWRLGDRELAHCISLVAPKIMLTQAEFAPRLDALGIEMAPICQIGPDYEALLAASPSQPPDVAVDPEDGLVILYTSGTTGLPKGALISHRAMVARAMFYASELGVPVGDVFCAWPPMYHMASTDHALATLMRGGTVLVVDGFQPDLLVDILKTEAMHLFILMPGMVRGLADALEARRAKPKGVQICGAMPDLIPREDIADITRLLNAPYLNSFGSTETGLPPATSNLLAIGVAPTSLAKRPSSFCELRLVDADDKQVPDGTPGEVAVRGPTLFSGYWNAAKTNAQDFRNGWFHLGDVMRRNPDGTLDYVDRLKYLIKSGGENIYPAEIEQVILQDARVVEAVVVRQPDAKWGEVPILFVVSADPGLTSAEITAYCRANLSGYKRPKQVFIVAAAELPRSTTGKIQRHLLEDRAAEMAKAGGGE